MEPEMIDIKDGRGSNRLALKEKNLKRVRDYFTKNPGSTKGLCCEKLNLAYKTVSRHVKAIQRDG